MAGYELGAGQQVLQQEQEAHEGHEIPSEHQHQGVCVFMLVSVCARAGECVCMCWWVCEGVLYVYRLT